MNTLRKETATNLRNYLTLEHSFRHSVLIKRQPLVFVVFYQIAQNGLLLRGEREAQQIRSA